MLEIDICPNCDSVLFSSMDPNSGKTKEHWDYKKKQKIKMKYKKWKYECSVCGYKFKEDERHYD